MSALQTSRLGWYARRAARMSPAEMAWRVRDRTLQTAWSNRQVSREQAAVDVSVPDGKLRFTAVLPANTAKLVPEEARAAVLAAADQLLRGEWEVLGTLRTDMLMPDWFHDPVTGRRPQRPASPSDSERCRRWHR